MKPIHMAGPWITEHEIKVVEDCMRNGWYGYEYVERFQREFAAWHGRKHGIMTPNCTHAIHLLLTALGIADGDEVIYPDCTWIASVAGTVYLRATPVLCDIDPHDWCLSPESVERRITPRTKAIVAVDLFGNMPRMDELRRIAQARGLHLIEDAAEALGSTYRGTRAGKFGIGSVFSFHRTKTLATGEGGMLLVDDDALYERCMFLRDHGRRKDGGTYVNYAVTYKYMPSNLQAAVGYAQFQRIDELVAKKRWILQRFRELLADVPDIELNPEPPGGVNGAWIAALVIGRSHGIGKAEAMRRLEARGLPVRPFFHPLSSLPAFPGLEAEHRRLNPVAYDVSSRGLNLPGALILEDEQLVHYCEGLRSVLAAGAAS